MVRYNVELTNSGENVLGEVTKRMNIKNAQYGLDNSEFQLGLSDACNRDLNQYYEMLKNTTVEILVRFRLTVPDILLLLHLGNNDACEQTNEPLKKLEILSKKITDFIECGELDKFWGRTLLFKLSKFKMIESMALFDFVEMYWNQVNYVSLDKFIEYYFSE